MLNYVKTKKNLQTKVAMGVKYNQCSR